jgi:hypothetical protein
MKALTIIDRLINELDAKHRHNTNRTTLFLGGEKQEEFTNALRLTTAYPMMKSGQIKTFMGQPVVLVRNLDIASWGEPYES